MTPAYAAMEDQICHALLLSVEIVAVVTPPSFPGAKLLLGQGKVGTLSFGENL
jgi:hypothetical protein